MNSTFADKDIALYLKILALAESSPEGGERANARRLLAKLEAKHPGIGVAAQRQVKNATPPGANTAAGTSDSVWKTLGIDPATLMREGGKLLFGLLAAYATGPDREVERLLGKVKAEMGEGGTSKKPTLELVLAVPVSTFERFLEDATDAQIDAVGEGLAAMIRELWVDAIAQALDVGEDEEDEDEDSEDDASA